MIEKIILETIISQETHIRQILASYSQKFRYIGPQGREYEVIFSLLSDLYHHKEWQNIHIRWFASIYHLLLSFRQFRYHYFPAEIQANLSQQNTESFAISKNNDEIIPIIPEHIEYVEFFLTEIVKSGIFLSSRKKNVKTFVDAKVTAYCQSLKKWLLDKEEKPWFEREEPIYLLAFYQGCLNGLKIANLASPSLASRYNGLINSELFTQAISGPAQSIPVEKSKDLFNLDLFWNGFIT